MIKEQKAYEANMKVDFRNVKEQADTIKRVTSKKHIALNYRKIRTLGVKNMVVISTAAYSWPGEPPGNSL